MDRVLDIDLEPPYVEVYQYAPLMYLSVCDFDLLSTSLPALEWLKWLHKVHCSVDAVATQCGVYKVKSASQGGSCAFSISPDMPPREQAAILLNCAKQLLQAMTEVRSSLECSAQQNTQADAHNMMKQPHLHQHVFGILLYGGTTGILHRHGSAAARLALAIKHSAPALFA
jgi:hypothetical protein